MKSEGFITWGGARARQSPVRRRKRRTRRAALVFPHTRKNCVASAFEPYEKRPCAHSPNEGLCAWLTSASTVIFSTSVPQALPFYVNPYTVSIKILCNSELLLKVAKGVLLKYPPWALMYALLEYHKMQHTSDHLCICMK